MKAENMKTKDQGKGTCKKILKSIPYFAKRRKMNNQAAYMVISEDDPAVPTKVHDLYNAFDKPEIKVSKRALLPF